MERQGCVDANVSISGLDRNKRYYISLATERGLGFSNQCAQRNLGFANLTGHRIYKFYFPLIACGRREFGTVTAEVRESPSNKLVATKTAEVTVAPERPVMGSYLHKKECLLTALFGELSSAGGWMSITVDGQWREFTVRGTGVERIDLGVNVWPGSTGAVGSTGSSSPPSVSEACESTSYTGYTLRDGWTVRLVGCQAGTVIIQLGRYVGDDYVLLRRYTANVSGGP